MGFFKTQKRELMRRSSLSLAVPYEGTDTVVGLRPMAYGHKSGVTHDEARVASKARAAPASQDIRSSYKRFRGPHLEHLPHDIWRSPPKSWRHFLYGSVAEFAYNVPEDTSHLQERMEENIVTYVSNYIWLAAGFLLCFVMFNWAAMFGVSAIAALVWLNYMYPPPSSQAQQLHQVEDQWAGLRTIAAVVTWIVVLYTQCTSLLLKWASVTLTAVLSHASLRCTMTEAVEALGSRKHAGVPIMAFLGDVRTREQPEPRKLARQIAAVLREQSGLLWNQTKFYSYYLLDAVRYPYVLYHHATDPRRT